MAFKRFFVKIDNFRRDPRSGNLNNQKNKNAKLRVFYANYGNLLSDFPILATTFQIFSSKKCYGHTLSPSIWKANDNKKLFPELILYEALFTRLP